MKNVNGKTSVDDAKLDHYYEKWLAIGLRHGPTTDVDRREAADAIVEAYSQAGLSAPKIIWARSPLDAITIAFNLGDKNIADDPMSGAGYGQHDASWLGYFDFFMNEFGLEEDIKELVPLMKLAQHAGWWWPYENVCIVSEIPVNISLNDIGNLHNPAGKAIEYADGFGLYALNGIVVPGWAIETPVDEIDPKKILALENTDQRMILMKHVGLAKFLKDLKARLIDEDQGDRLYYLTVEGREIGPYLYLKCPSTGREFLEGVGDAEKYEFIDPTIKTCKQAHKFREEKASNGFMTDRLDARLYHA